MKRYLAVGALALAALLALPAAAAHAETAPPTFEPGSVEIAETYPSAASLFGSYELPQLSAEENELLNSDEQVTVMLSAETGEVISVEKASAESGFTARGVTQNNCNLGKACWYGWLGPDAYYGFTPGGTNTGTWSSRGTFNTGSYIARPCWASNAQLKCSQVYLEPGKNFTFDNAVTGKRVDFL